MAKSKSGTLRMTLSGDGINPRTLSANKLGELISSYESALIHMVNSEYKTLNPKEVFVSLVEIKEGSADLAFRPSVEEVFTVAQTINEKIKVNKFQDLPFGTVESLHKIWVYTKQNNCVAILNGQPDVPKASISPEVEISVDESFFYEGETVIYGKVVRVGGAVPRIRIKIEDGQVFSIEVKAAEAKKLANRLYDIVGLKGIAKWRKDTFGIENFKFIELIPFQERPITEGIKEMANIIGESWSVIDDPLDYIAKTRYSE